jgi:outer membrane protein
MKKALILLIASFFVFSGEIFAQKYGHVNTQEVVESMPEFKQLNAAVDKKTKDAQTKVQQMYNAYQEKVKEVNQYGASMMEAVLAEKKKEIDSLQQSIGIYQQTAGTEIQSYKEKLFKPLFDKYHKIVAAVAKENGYTYVFDTGSGSLLYYPETTGDITGLVKKKIGTN